MMTSVVVQGKGTRSMGDGAWEGLRESLFPPFEFNVSGVELSKPRNI